MKKAAILTGVILGTMVFAGRAKPWTQTFLAGGTNCVPKNVSGQSGITASITEGLKNTGSTSSFAEILCDIPSHPTHIYNVRRVDLEVKDGSAHMDAFATED